MEVALFGNPNTGKTSLFNVLTGSYEFVGNWNGVTVEKKVGHFKNDLGSLVDLPGIYTLTPISKDEAVASEFLLNNTFTSVLNIIDASQLARNLHLTIELLEFGKPSVIGLNMIDVAKHRGLEIDTNKLSRNLGVPVIPLVARTGHGCNAVIETFSDEKQIPSQHFCLDYGVTIEKAINELCNLMKDNKLNHRWLAIQYLLGNQTIRNHIDKEANSETVSNIIQSLEQTLRREDKRLSIAQWMYRKRKSYIENLLNEVVQKNKPITKATLTDKLDSIVTHKYIGIPLFLAIMYLIFHATFNWIGSPLSDQLDAFFSGPLTDWVSKALTWANVTPFIRDVILNGIIAGVGGVIVFVPQIFVLFFFISLLEDSGYMARVAVVMDRLMQAVGLNGKAFIPLVIGFGCNIPGIMAARSIEQPKERLITVLISPLMSCSARLTVYSLFVGAFFEKDQAIIVLSLYVLGIVVAMIMAKIFSLFMKNEKSVFVVELPPYRLPNLPTLFRSTWDKAKGFVRKAGTFILGGTIVIWLLSYVGPGGINVAINHSILAIICSMLAPLVAPLGFGTWQAASALITGFLAKESVVSSLAITYHVAHGQTLTGVISQAFTPLQAYSLMVFTLLYIPCMSTVPAIHREVGTRKLTLFTICYCVVLAYVISFIIYHAGLLLGFK